MNFDYKGIIKKSIRKSFCFQFLSLLSEFKIFAYKRHCEFYNFNIPQFYGRAGYVEYVTVTTTPTFFNNKNRNIPQPRTLLRGRKAKYSKSLKNFKKLHENIFPLNRNDRITILLSRLFGEGKKKLFNCSNKPSSFDRNQTTVGVLRVLISHNLLL